MVLVPITPTIQNPLLPNQRHELQSLFTNMRIDDFLTSSLHNVNSIP